MAWLRLPCQSSPCLHHWRLRCRGWYQCDRMEGGKGGVRLGWSSCSGHAPWCYLERTLLRNVRMPADGKVSSRTIWNFGNRERLNRKNAWTAKTFYLRFRGERAAAEKLPEQKADPLLLCERALIVRHPMGKVSSQAYIWWLGQWKSLSAHIRTPAKWSCKARNPRQGRLEAENREHADSGRVESVGRKACTK